MFDHIKPPKNFPETIHVVVEIPRGCHNKYEYDEHLNVIKLDRVLHSSVMYPTDYGFVPQTLSEDGDHADALVLTNDPLFPGCLVSARVVGMADMEDEAGKDWKLLAVAEKDPSYANVTELSQINPHRLDEIQNFFETYKLLENKEVRFHGWQDRQAAYEILNQSLERFKKEHQ